MANKLRQAIRSSERTQVMHVEDFTAFSVMTVYLGEENLYRVGSVNADE